MTAPESPGDAAVASFLERVLDRELEALDGRTTVVAADARRSPADRLAALVADADAVVGVVPVAAPSLLDLVRGNDADGVRVTVVVTGDARERLRELPRPVVRMSLAGRDGALYEHDGDAPVGALLVDDRAVVAGFSAGRLRELLVSDAPAIRRWVEETVARYRDAAEPLN